MKDISLYFHIPFCTRKCGYCHFYVLPDQESNKDLLLEGFKREWELWQPLLKKHTISTIYFGGGTPFLLGPSRLASLLQLIRNDFSIPSSIEITLEANPENVRLSLMQEYAQAGINRVSLGIQSLDENLLKILGRLHDAQTAINAVEWTQQAGIKNISVDLMYDLPQQTIASWESTLHTIGQLPITHLSLYNLTIEPHTLFFKKQDQLRPFIPDETTSLAMYEKAIESLEARGLKQYEISAFAQPGYHSKHNVGYWTARPFIGFGPSAFSYLEGRRFKNVSNLKRYCEALNQGNSPIDFEEQLNPQAQLRELFVIQLRLKEGVNLHTFEQQHGALDLETQTSLHRLSQEGFLTGLDHQIRLTKRGILFYDTVASELI